MHTHTIIQVPHKTLRKIAQPVERVDENLLNLVKGLETTLKKKKNPRGVGLAAPQINTSLRLFTLNVSSLQTIINPEIIKTSQKKSFGPDPKDPYMEGCLSIPELYGPVPRWEWVEAEFQILKDGKLVSQKARFDAFHARVFQHELDHLNGVLFTDYALEFDLPVYREYAKDKFEEIDHQVIELF